MARKHPCELGRFSRAMPAQREEPAFELRQPLTRGVQYRLSAETKRAIATLLGKPTSPLSRLCAAQRVPLAVKNPKPRFQRGYVLHRVEGELEVVEHGIETQLCCLGLEKIKT